ncbi:MAG: hypothetical protein ABI661_06140 [Gammaproteobacteria bacterium]
MTFFRNSRSKRRIVATMLVFWLFALGAAWANACALQDRWTHRDAASAAADAMPAPASGQVGVLDPHRADHSSGTAPCLKACDERSQSIVKWQSSIDLLDLAMAAPTGIAWTATNAVLDAARPARVGHPARADLPVRTRYSRLAL